MKIHARRRTGATRVRTRSANISGSSFGHHVRILQGNLNIFKDWGNRAFSPSDKPSAAVQAQLEEKEKMDCRHSLSFCDIDARLHNILPVQPGTCEWIFEMPLFRRWYDPSEHDNGLLWVKGNPGTGKSTLMKHILEHCQTKEDYVIAAYFFNARGAELEQTPLGMLRSLLFQLLEQEPLYYDALLPIFRKKQEDHGMGGWEWREPELKSFFLSKIPKCQSRPLLLIIDALDECSERDVQNVAEFLQDLSNNAVDAGLTLNICLSSRHYPFIRFNEYQELILEKEKQHDEDIIKYISTNLAIKDETIEEAIREKSSGIFLWVVLVTRILNKAYEDGKTEAMKQKLDETPAELGEVFETILKTNNSNKDETILILQCVLFAKRLLTPEEIYFAIIAGTNSQALSRWDSSQVTPDIIRRRIRSSSMGLVEIRRSKNETTLLDHKSFIDGRCRKIKLQRRGQVFTVTSEGEKETVQFIHKSVYDFLVRNRRLQRLDPGLMPNPVAKSHNRLKDCCLSYLMMDPLELQNVEGTGSDFPFLEYASRYLFDHAEEATSVDQAELLQSLVDLNVWKRVERFHNYFVDYGQDGAHIHLLQILAARNLPKFLGFVVEWGADINGIGMPCGTALEAAIEFESEETVKTLLSMGAKTNVHGESYDDQVGHTALYRAFEKGNRGILAMLIDRGATLGTFERILAGSVLYHAVETGDKDIIAMVLDKGAKVNARGVMGNALCSAAKEGYEEIVEMLLEKGAKIHTGGGGYCSPLVYAATGGHVEVVKSLIEKGSNIHARGLAGNSLEVATIEGHTEVVELLLEKGAKINTRGLLGSPLELAAMGGHIEVVELLLEKGAKINTRGLLGSPLGLAAMVGEKEITEMLLNKGAKINTRGILGSPLQLAAMAGEKEIVEMLLNKGAKIDARGGLFGSALHAVVSDGNKEMVEFLLEKGANINARGWLAFPLLIAKLDKLSEEKEHPQASLEKGLKGSSWRIYGTAIQAAVALGEEEIIQLLLDKGAKI
ncbi:ankyrin repeat-containing domain protein [Trichoderma sp. SZMC 28015]